jgi:hypothetical protein
LNDLCRTEQARPELGHPYQQRPVTAAQSRTRRRMSQGNAELMTSRHRDLNKATMNIPSEYRIASIAPNHALILPNDANPGRMQFSERTPCPFSFFSNTGRGSGTVVSRSDMGGRFSSER